MRSRQMSAEELVRTSLERIERLNPQINAVISVREQASGRGTRARRPRRRRGGPGSARRHPAARQGHGSRRGRAHHLRVPGVRGRAGGRRRRTDPPAPQGRRRDRGGQDQPAGVRVRGVHRQPPVRGHAEPVEPRGLARRLLGWIGGGDGGRDRPDRDRHRRGRLDPDPGRLVGARRAQADERGDRPGADPGMDRSLDVRTARPLGGGRPAPAGDRGGSCPRRPQRTATAAGDARRDAGARVRRPAHRGLRTAAAGRAVAVRRGCRGLRARCGYAGGADRGRGSSGRGT